MLSMHIVHSKSDAWCCVYTLFTVRGMLGVVYKTSIYWVKTINGETSKNPLMVATLVTINGTNTNNSPILVTLSSKSVFGILRGTPVNGM